MCADRSGSGCPTRPGLSSPVHWKGKLPEERPRSGGRERFPQATGAIVLRLPEEFSASALLVGAQRRNKPSRVSATVLPVERQREKKGDVLGGPRKRPQPAWTVRLRNRT